MLPTVSPFSNEWITSVVFLLGIFGLIGLSELARVKLNWTPELSRKFVHVLVGLFALMSPFLFVSNGPPVALAIIFIVVNLVAIKSKKFEGMHATKRKSYGTVYFPLAYLILCLFWWERQITFQIALLLLTFADTAAAIVGEGVRKPESYRPWHDQKTIQGTIVMALTSALLTGLGTTLFRSLAGMEPLELQLLVPLSLFVAAMATIAEAVSDSGSDNLSIPIVTAVTYDLFFESVGNGSVAVLIMWILLSFIMAQGAFSLRVLTSDGALAAFVLGVFVFGIGGWKFMIPLAAFFVLSSLLSRIGKKSKKDQRQSFGKESERDMVQVYANGGIPLILTIWWLYNPSDIIYFAYLSSVVAATADTWATEIGFFSPYVPRDIVTFRKVASGASGGVTFLGSVGGLLGATVIAASAWFFIQDLKVLSLVIAVGFAANVFDSILGATVQASYTCGGCSKRVEVAHHCDEPATLISGSKFINNDTVNLFCTLSGGAIILLMG